jgi:tRNA threonylcarbamoyladenosine biosynthesis protein TsaB
MPFILHIDTATDYAGVCLSRDGKLIAKEEDINQKNHASFLHIAIQQLLKKTNYDLHALDAIAVTGGPGSYTGIRVGLSSAKGICYALNKPLIMLNTLQVIAAAAQEKINERKLFSNLNYCIYPMIDARRMEVFGGIYTKDLLPKGETSAIIIDESFYISISKMQHTVFCGNGSLKINNDQLNSNQLVIDSQHSVNQMIALSERAFVNNDFADLAYVEPIYTKEFYNPKQ